MSDEMRRDAAATHPERVESGNSARRGTRVASNQSRRVAAPVTESVPSPALGDQKKGSVDFVVAEMLRSLHDGQYVPGQKLIEADLTQRFAVSRGTLREALRKLESEGFATTSLHRGARIRIFSRDDVRDIFEVAEHMAGLAARLAAERLSRTKDASTLRAVLSDMAKHVGNGESFEIGRCRYRFMEAVVSLTENHELRHLLPRFDASVMRAQFKSVYDLRAAKQDLEQFQLIFEAIQARDAARAEQAMRQYIRGPITAIQRLPDSHFAS